MPCRVKMKAPHDNQSWSSTFLSLAWTSSVMEWWHQFLCQQKWHTWLGGRVCACWCKLPWKPFTFLMDVDHVLFERQPSFSILLSIQASILAPCEYSSFHPGRDRDAGLVRSTGLACNFLRRKLHKAGRMLQATYVFVLEGVLRIKDQLENELQRMKHWWSCKCCGGFGMPQHDHLSFDRVLATSENSLLFHPPSWKWKKGPSKICFLWIRVVLHFHDYGRKGKMFKLI